MVLTVQKLSRVLSSLLLIIKLLSVCSEIMVCLGGNDDSVSKQVDMISARGHLSELQQKLDSSETQRKRARIEYERDVESIRKDRKVLLTD